MSTNREGACDPCNQGTLDVDECLCPIAPSPTPDAALTEEERRPLGCQCWRLDDVWHHERNCPVPAVERILAARMVALTERLADVDSARIAAVVRAEGAEAELAEVEAEHDTWKTAAGRRLQRAHEAENAQWAAEAREAALRQAVERLAVAQEALAVDLEAEKAFIAADNVRSCAMGMTALLAEHATPSDSPQGECRCRIIGIHKDPYEPHIPAQPEWEQADDCPVHPIPAPASAGTGRDHQTSPEVPVADPRGVALDAQRPAAGAPPSGEPAPSDRAALSKGERDLIIDTGRHVYGCCAADCEHHGLPEDAQIAAVERILSVRLAAVERVRTAVSDERRRDPSTYNVWSRVTRAVDAALAGTGAQDEAGEDRG